MPFPLHLLYHYSRKVLPPWAFCCSADITYKRNIRYIITALHRHQIVKCHLLFYFVADALAASWLQVFCSFIERSSIESCKVCFRPGLLSPYHRCTASSILATKLSVILVKKLITHGHWLTYLALFCKKLEENPGQILDHSRVSVLFRC